MKFHFLLNFIALLVFLTKKAASRSAENPSVQLNNYTNASYERTSVLSRRRRYAAFPEGSSFSVAFCASVGMYGNPRLDYFSWALNWGLAYDLPNHTWIVNELNKKHFPKPFVQRRHRRELYNRMELAIDKMGHNGRGCILRALCESAQYFYNSGLNMFEELLRTIFFMPSMRVLPFEHTDLLAYDEAYRKGTNRAYCAASYPQCSFSIIGSVLGEPVQSYDYT